MKTWNGRRKIDFLKNLYKCLLQLIQRSSWEFCQAPGTGSLIAGPARALLVERVDRNWTMALYCPSSSCSTGFSVPVKTFVNVHFNELMIEFTITFLPTDSLFGEEFSVAVAGGVFSSGLAGIVASFDFGFTNGFVLFVPTLVVISFRIFSAEFSFVYFDSFFANSLVESFSNDLSSLLELIFQEMKI